VAGRHRNNKEEEEMCLDRSTNFRIRSCYGYKVFICRADRVYTGIGSGEEQEMSFTHYVKASVVLQLTCNYDDKPYLSGFHIYLKRNDAAFYRRLYPNNNHFVFKVAFKDVVAKGYQVGQVVVAREIKLMEKICV
jgi:hypothetical protein